MELGHAIQEVIHDVDEPLLGEITHFDCLEPLSAQFLNHDLRKIKQKQPNIGDRFYYLLLEER